MASRSEQEEFALLVRFTELNLQSLFSDVINDLWEIEDREDQEQAFSRIEETVRIVLRNIRLNEAYQRYKQERARDGREAVHDRVPADEAAGPR